MNLVHGDKVRKAVQQVKSAMPWLKQNGIRVTIDLSSVTYLYWEPIDHTETVWGVTYRDADLTISEGDETVVTGRVQMGHRTVDERQYGSPTNAETYMLRIVDDIYNAVLT